MTDRYRNWLDGEIARVNNDLKEINRKWTEAEARHIALISARDVYVDALKEKEGK
jgi:hypothetical protein